MIFFRCLLVLVGSTVFLPAVQAQSVEAERARIENTRAQVHATFAVEHAACQQKFAVNSCLNESNARRREAIADLRRQEISLNDDERRRRGAEQVRRAEEKLSASHRQASSDRRAQILSNYTDRVNRERGSNKTKQEQATTENRPTVLSAEMRTRKKLLVSDKQFTSSARKADQFNDRYDHARERREKHGALASKRPLSTAKPLPIPP